MGSDFPSDFEDWWSLYPKKVKKMACEKKYATIIREKRADAKALLIGLRRYISHKPDWQNWADPLTWLNQGRWADEHETQAPEKGEYRPAPVKTYLKTSRRVKLTEGEKKRVSVRAALHDDLRQEGLCPYQMPKEAYDARLTAKREEMGQ